jgi:hypothetical protein
MIGRHEVLELGEREHRFLHPLRSTHGQLASAMNMPSTTISSHATFTRQGISTAC